jgi:hypothetical protein
MSFNGIEILNKFGIKRVKETDEEIVIRMLRGDFEQVVGVPYDKFCEIHKTLVENNPEKLI